MADFKVTPWEVEGRIDYDRLIKEFGTKPLGPELLKRIGKKGKLHVMLRRGYFFSHRDLELVLDLVLPRQGRTTIVLLLPMPIKQMLMVTLLGMYVIKQQSNAPQLVMKIVMDWLIVLIQIVLMLLSVLILMVMAFLIMMIIVLMQQIIIKQTPMVIL